MPLPRSSRLLLIATLALGGLLVVLTVVTIWQPSRPAEVRPSFRVTVWGKFSSFQDGRLMVNVVKAPTEGERLPESIAMVGEVLPIAVRPGMLGNLEYYQGDISSGTLVLREPFELASLRPGAVLKIIATVQADRTLAADSVTWPQSTTQPNVTEPAAQASATPLPEYRPDAVIRPPRRSPP